MDKSVYKRTNVIVWVNGNEEGNRVWLKDGLLYIQTGIKISDRHLLSNFHIDHIATIQEGKMERYKLIIEWRGFDDIDEEYFDDYDKAKAVEQDYKETYPNTIKHIEVTKANGKEIV